MKQKQSNVKKRHLSLRLHLIGLSGTFYLSSLESRKKKKCKNNIQGTQMLPIENNEKIWSQSVFGLVETNLPWVTFLFLKCILLFDKVEELHFETQGLKRAASKSVFDKDKEL